MDLRLANKVEIGQLFSEFAIRSAQFASVNEYSLYAVVMLSIITSESIANSELHAKRFSFYSLIRSELVASVIPAIAVIITILSMVAACFSKSKQCDHTFELSFI